MSDSLVGKLFQHQSILDPDWKPAPGQKYADAPKAIMIVTRVFHGSVYFKYASQRDSAPFLFLDLPNFIDRYGKALFQ
jgi:hypothetical protein